MTSYGNLEFKEILQDNENLYCFDCGKTPAQWASINNSVFLCITCSGNHRGYGVHISFIKSITLDTWNENQLNFMKIGGNKNCRKLLEKYGIDKNKVNKNILYHSKIMNYYRNFLKNKVNNIPMEIQPPSNEDALKNFEGIQLNNSENNKFSSIGNQNDEKKEENIFSNFIKGTKDVYNKIGDMKITEKIKNVGKNISTSVKEKGTEIKNSNFAKNAQDTLSYYVNWMMGNKKKDDDKREIKNNINNLEKEINNDENNVNKIEENNNENNNNKNNENKNENNNNENNNNH